MRGGRLPRVRRYLAAVLAAAGTGGGLATAAEPAETEITYSVGKRGQVRSDLEGFARVVESTLQDRRGWPLGGRIEFRRVSSGGDMRVLLASPAEVDDAAPTCQASWSCRTGRRVFINDERWRNASGAWSASRRAYRHYVINHEVGHFLGLEKHRRCPEPGTLAPVMQQQSISLQGCRPNPWPTPAEVRAAAAAQDVPAPAGGPAPAIRDPGQRNGGRGGEVSDEAASPSPRRPQADSPDFPQGAARAESGREGRQQVDRDVGGLFPIISLVMVIAMAVAGRLVGGLGSRRSKSAGAPSPGSGTGEAGTGGAARAGAHARKPPATEAPTGGSHRRGGRGRRSRG